MPAAGPGVASRDAVVFTVGGTLFALPAERVQEVQRIVAFEEIPDRSGWLLGMADVRGTMAPVLDLRRLLGMPAEPLGLDTPMIVCRLARGLVVFLADEVLDVVGLPDEGLRRPPGVHPLADRMLGVWREGEDLVSMLDADRLLPDGVAPEVVRSGRA